MRSLRERRQPRHSPGEPHDWDAIDAVVAAAFRSTAESELVRAIRSSPEYVPELALVAEEAGKVVGHVMVSHTELHDGAVRNHILQLSPLAVRPDRQRQGIGSALVDAVLSAAAALDAPFVVLEGDPGYYRRFGFEPSAPHGVTIDLPAWAPAAAAQIKVLRDYDPGIRGRVLYPPAFAPGSTPSAVVPLAGICEGCLPARAVPTANLFSQFRGRARIDLPSC